MAAALQQAFAMPATERAMRMVRMRSRIRVCNVYDWYANFRAALGFATHHALIGPEKSHIPGRMTTAAG